MNKWELQREKRPNRSGPELVESHWIKIAIACAVIWLSLEIYDRIAFEMAKRDAIENLNLMSEQLKLSSQKQKLARDRQARDRHLQQQKREIAKNFREQQDLDCRKKWKNKSDNMLKNCLEGIEKESLSIEWSERK